MSELILNCEPLFPEEQAQLLSNENLSKAVRGVTRSRTAEITAPAELDQQFAEIAGTLGESKDAQQSSKIFSAKEAALNSLATGQIILREVPPQARIAHIVDTAKDSSILRISKGRAGETLYGRRDEDALPSKELFGQGLIIAATIGRILGYKELYIEYESSTHHDTLDTFGFTRQRWLNIVPRGPYITTL